PSFAHPDVWYRRGRPPCLPSFAYPHSPTSTNRKEGTKVDITELNKFGSRYAQAWCSQDPKSVAAFFAEGGSLSVNDNAAAVGREDIAKIALGFMTDFPDMRVAMDEVVPQSECVVFHWTFTGI